MHKLRWDDLQFVLAVAEEGSLAAAARQLGVNHATVLRRVAAFEKRHEIRLFDREASGYRLTPESASILETIRSVQKAVDGLQRSFAGHGSELEGGLRMTSTDSLSQTVLPRHLHRFNQRHPRMAVELRVTNSRLNFERPDADLTVRPAAVLPADLEGEYVCDLAFRVYAAPAYLAAYNSTNPANHRWLGLTDGIKNTPPGRWLDGIVPAGSVVLRSDSFVALCRLAQAGLGLAIAPCCLGDTMPGLTRAQLFPAETRTKLWVASHPDMMRSPRIRACAAFFVEALREDTTLLQGG